VVSFDEPSLKVVRELHGEARLGLDFSGRLLPVRRALTLGAEALLPHWAIASRGLIRRAHQAGLQVFPWTVNYPSHMHRKILDGADGLITNYPARLTQILAQIERKEVSSIKDQG
jgi:glycerophosphoryl diester phosphodiesterase